jgi:hypothetical protein
VQAAKWYRMAAEQGDVDSQNRLAALYLAGDGVPQDYAEAARWYRKAADQGDIEAPERARLALRQRPRRGERLRRGLSLVRARGNAESGTDFETHENAARNRDLVATRMTPAEIAEAQSAPKRGSRNRDSRAAGLRPESSRSMPDDHSSSAGAHWTRVIERARVAPSQPVAVKLRGKHIALFVHERRSPGLQQPLSARRLSVGRRARSTQLRADVSLAQLEVRSSERRDDLRRRQPARLSRSRSKRATSTSICGTRLPRLESRRHSRSSTTQSPNSTPARIARELARLGKAGAGPGSRARAGDRGNA